MAAFAKRLARLALIAPPDVLLTLIPFIGNLLVRHPSLIVLIDRPNISEGNLRCFLIFLKFNYLKRLRVYHLKGE